MPGWIKNTILRIHCHLAGAKAAGLRVTAYHFAAPDNTPGEAIAAADHFVTVSNLDTGRSFQGGALAPEIVEASFK